MPVYMIVEAKEIMDKDKYAEYVRRAPATIAAFGGRYLARGGEVNILAGDWQPCRLIIVEFASMENFRCWWQSPEYRAIARLREESARTNAVLIEGCEEKTL